MITALYDGQCVICQSTRRIIKSLDSFNRIEFLDLHDKETLEARYPELDYEALMGEIHVMADDKIYAGFAATRRMLKAVPPGFPLWLILQMPGMNWLGVRIYRFIATNRYAVNHFFGIDLGEANNCVEGVCKIPE